MLTKIIASISGYTHNVQFSVIFSYKMFSIIQYDMWYQFEKNKTFLQIYIMKNVILLEPEYLNQQIIYKNQIYRMHRIHEDVSTKKIS